MRNLKVAIAEALDAMPEQFMEALQNVAVVWEEEPSAYHLGYDDDEEPARPAADAAENDCEEESGEDELDDLLGLFDGLVHRRASQRLRRRHPRRHYHLQRPPRALLSTAARKSWKRSARLSSTNWATTSASARINWPPWATSRCAPSPDKQLPRDRSTI